MRAPQIRDALLIWLERRITGALTWAQTLANGNTSGPTSPTISAGASLIFNGQRDAPAVTLSVDDGIPAAPIWGVFGAPLAGTAGAVAESFFFETGEASATVPGPGPSSGLFNLLTGGTVDGGGLAGPSGAFLIQTGAVTSTGGADASGGATIQTGAVTGGSRRSGNLRFATGVSTTTGRSGDVEQLTGDNSGSGDSGSIQHRTGNTDAGDSGDWSAITGNSVSGRAGAVSVLGGSGQTAGGATLSAGATLGPGDGASTVVNGGSAVAGTGGPLWLLSGTSSSGVAGRIQLGLIDAGGVGQQSELVWAPLTEWFAEGPGISSRAVWRKKITTDVAAVPTTIADDPDFEFQNNFAGTSQGSTNQGLTLIQPTGVLGEYSVIRTDQTAGVSSWGKPNLSRASRYVVGGVVAPSVLQGRYEVGARPTTSAFDNTTDDNKTILFFDPSFSANWQACTSNAGIDTIVDTGIPGGGRINYMIRINTSNQAEYWLSNPARGGRLELCATGTVGIGLSGCILYAGCVCNSGGTTPQMEWGDPIQALTV
jgi:hypothetical protein